MLTKIRSTFTYPLNSTERNVAEWVVSLIHLYIHVYIGRERKNQCKYLLLTELTRRTAVFGYSVKYILHIN